jgi:hypothetical protein
VVARALKKDKRWEALTENLSPKPSTKWVETIIRQKLPSKSHLTEIILNFSVWAVRGYPIQIGANLKELQKEK